MMKRFLIALLIVIVAGGAYLWWQNQNKEEEMTENDSEMTDDISAMQEAIEDGAVMEDGVVPEGSTEETSDVPQAGGSGITMANVAVHNSASSCWTVIDGNVYDLTTWIPQHPGGQAAIRGLCGKDGIEAFHGQHGNAQKQADILLTMQIGILAE